MARYIIDGGNKLEGQVKISGNKNSVFPALSAALLVNEEIILSNIPDIVDTKTCLEILKTLGAMVSFENNQVRINCQGVKVSTLPTALTKRLRGSIVFVGGLLSRFGYVEFIHPGGDVIGKRSIETHLEGFRKLGFGYEENGENYKVFAKDLSLDKEIFLDEASVTATENLILASVMADCVVTLKNCAMEPHVVDLCNLLIGMGAKICGVGTPKLVIQGVDKLKGTKFSIGCDYLEFGTFAIASALTRGEVDIGGCSLEEIEPIKAHLEKFGINFKPTQHGFVVTVSKLSAVPQIKTNIWPGYPTDMMSLTIVLATQAKGVTLCHDWMYESRMFFVDKLIAMGANITIADPHRVVVHGPTKLLGHKLESPDIRAGMALVLASLVSNGESVIERAELIERGYENVVGKLTSLGADISKLE